MAIPETQAKNGKAQQCAHCGRWVAYDEAYYTPRRADEGRWATASDSGVVPCCNRTCADAYHRQATA